MKQEFSIFPPSGKFTLAFRNVGRVRVVIGRCDCGHDKHFYKPKKKCEVTDSGVYYIDYTARER